VPESRKFSNVERPPVFPVCLVIDVSLSMDGAPIGEVNKALPDLQSAIRQDPTAGEVARISLVTFSSTARVVVPMAGIHEVSLPTLRVESETNFAAGLRTAREAVEDGIRGLGTGTRYYKPVVFFLSDGEHNAAEDWKPAKRRLSGGEDKYRAEIVSFGMGVANRAAIREVSTGHAFFAEDEDPATAVRAIIKSIIGSIKTTSGSIGSATGAALTIPSTTGLTPLGEFIAE
jgi:uncharacterized protein YegL